MSGWATLVGGLVGLLLLGAGCREHQPRDEHEFEAKIDRLLDRVYDLGRRDQHAIDCALLEREVERWTAIYAEVTQRPDALREDVQFAIERHMQANRALTIVASGETEGGGVAESFGRSLCETLTWSGAPGR